MPTELAEALLVLLKDDERREAMGRAGRAAGVGPLQLGCDRRGHAYAIPDAL